VIARRRIVVVLGVSALAAPLVSLAQQQRNVPRIGFLMSETLAAQADTIDAVRAGLLDHGYVDGKNIAIELRAADGDYDRLPELAAELARLKVDVIVAFGTKAVSAAVRATATIPIVDPSMGDPVALGLSSGLARPGKNVTGIVQFSAEIGAKRVEFLKQALPRIARIAVLVNPVNVSTPTQIQAMRATANALKLELQVFEVRSAKEIRESIATAAQRRVEGIIITTDTLFRPNFVEIANLAAGYRLLSAGPKEFPAAGGLIGYSTDRAEQYRHSAYFVDRILKGAKPDDLPIERVTKLQLVINAKTAHDLGIAIPQSLLLRADEVIQ
jgi:putative tryptophan/tyrosine transport system substrate-binding protein